MGWAWHAREPQKRLLMRYATGGRLRMIMAGDTHGFMRMTRFFIQQSSNETTNSGRSLVLRQWRFDLYLSARSWNRALWSIDWPLWHSKWNDRRIVGLGSLHPTVWDILDRLDIYIMPMISPNGFESTHQVVIIMSESIKLSIVLTHDRSHCGPRWRRWWPVGPRQPPSQHGSTRRLPDPWKKV